MCVLCAHTHVCTCVCVLCADTCISTHLVKCTILGWIVVCAFHCCYDNMMYYMTLLEVKSLKWVSRPVFFLEAVGGEFVFLPFLATERHLDSLAHDPFLL